MANRIGGTAFWYADGRQLALHGAFTVGPSRFERTGVAGLDRTHGYIEAPVVQYIEGDVSTIEGTSIEDVDAITDATITAELANGSVFTLRNAWRAQRSEINAHDGRFKVRFEGMSAVEFTA